MDDVLRQDKLRQFPTIDHFPGNCVKMDTTKPEKKISHGTEMWKENSHGRAMWERRTFPMVERRGKGDLLWQSSVGEAELQNQVRNPLRCSCEPYL